MVVASLLISRSITSPIAKLSDVMHRLANGDLYVDFDTSRRDEIGTMAKAVGVFKETRVAKHLADERERLDNENRMQSTKRLESLAGGFDGVAKRAIGEVGRGRWRTAENIRQPQ